MHTYFAASAKAVEAGSLHQCIIWARLQIANKKAKIVKIIKVRPNERDGRIVFDVTKDCISTVRNGRIVKTSFLKKEQKNG